MFEDIKAAVDDILYRTQNITHITKDKKEIERIHIQLGLFFDGNSVGAYYEEPMPHTVRIFSDENFGEWLGYITFDPNNYKEEIDLVAKRFGVSFDLSKCELSITFRRNEMTLAEAIMRLTEAMMITGSFRRYIFFKGKY